METLTAYALGKKPRPRLFVYLDSEPEAFVADIRRLGTLLLVAPDIVAAGEEQLLEMQDDFASAEGG